MARVHIPESEGDPKAPLKATRAMLGRRIYEHHYGPGSWARDLRSGLPFRTFTDEERAMGCADAPPAPMEGD
jgi:hypothetical protein